MCYDAQTQLFILRIGASVFNRFYPGETVSGMISTGAPAIEPKNVGSLPQRARLYFNYNLYRLFSSMPGILFTTDPADPLAFFIPIIAYSDGTYQQQTLNGVSYNNITAEVNSQYAWNQLSRIVITTGSIPVDAEYMFTGNAQNKSNEQIAIVQDFEPYVTGDFKTNNVFQYNPTGPWRLINLNSTTPMYKFDIKVYWQDAIGRLYPLLIGPGDFASFLFAFKKKKT
jgi:hypothetical protein